MTTLRTLRLAPAPLPSKLAPLDANLIEAVVIWLENQTKYPFVPPFSNFDSSYLPSEPIKPYLHRFNQNIEFSEGTLVVMCLIINSYFEHSPGQRLHTYNIHRIVLASLFIAHKFVDDKSYKNQVIAQLGGVEVDELNTLEITLFTAIKYKIDYYCCPEKYNKIVNELNTPEPSEIKQKTALSQHSLFKLFDEETFHSPVNMPLNKVEQKSSVWKCSIL